MKKVFFVFFGLILVGPTFSQKSSNPEERLQTKIKINDWGKAAMIIVDDVWNKVKSQIIAQVGEQQYQKIKQNYNWQSIPKEMSIFNGHSIKNPEVLYKKLDSLNYLSQVAYYDLPGSGRYVIIEVPYQGNENWDKNSKWDTVYFIIPQIQIEVVVKN